MKHTKGTLEWDEAGEFLAYLRGIETLVPSQTSLTAS
ncbi:hypothetical protein CDSM653_02387 [Caldanaerobacter subterraneus subsp. pacificus DSM 12653]|uniref:Uncharacterized protein n=1 Tax=Caldanaerobacter subterraneus subsp. pacificus DSM 12653 TaxID=391606 RepID=A0A0F5PJ40_9THEO|nr:hypothetical protein CDSM653_02386 [Caldanaerobacter subterraneus subsp. pacificus DSM 12653]KKC28620.1 hypothetical protein CDSM653_02387 [Caldanaerobacter subterraneus subsp. pacificus DSM 12653]